MYGGRNQPLTRDPTMGYLKLNLASQSRRLSISILPKPCKHCRLSCLLYTSSIAPTSLNAAAACL